LTVVDDIYVFFFEGDLDAACGVFVQYVEKKITALRENIGRKEAQIAKIREFASNNVEGV
jgi:hypothetical protein